MLVLPNDSRLDSGQAGERQGLRAPITWQHPEPDHSAGIIQERVARLRARNVSQQPWASSTVNKGGYGVREVEPEFVEHGGTTGGDRHAAQCCAGIKHSQWLVSMALRRVPA
jgi:hypothetical protein